MDRWKGFLFSLNAVANFSHQGQIKKTTLPEESSAKEKEVYKRSTNELSE
jgi:hypothetical protein